NRRDCRHALAGRVDWESGCMNQQRTIGFTATRVSMLGGQVRGENQVVVEGVHQLGRHQYVCAGY
ncbi:hypothetical protein KAV67_01255, partial [Candidatus Bipolaricaulota bacterium]|nr:hypothetical protein [Candidatus Bipolaricaulota bacterium]